jgi:hypothetical protein
MPKAADFILDRLRQWGIRRIFGLLVTRVAAAQQHSLSNALDS